MTPGPRLTLAQSAVAERIADAPRTVDWFGVVSAITEAHVADLAAADDGADDR